MKGVTNRPGDHRPDGGNFNPHTREGCDCRRDRVYRFVPLISIHTPVKGVTWTRTAFVPEPSHFNPHTREGCDARRCSGGRSGRNFNPHTREGCDGCPAGPRGCGPYFNPHTREGCDPNGVCFRPERLTTPVKVCDRWIRSLRPHRSQPHP